MKKNFLLSLIFSLLIFTSMADNSSDPQQSRNRAPQHEMNRAPQRHPRGGFSFEQFQEDKCNFIIKELELTPAETERFLPVYKELLQAKSSLYHKYGDSHRVMRNVSEGQNVPDSTMQRAAKNSRQLQVEDAKLEQDYLEKFEKILSPVQIIKLQEAEQKFKNEMMKRAPMPRHQR